MHHVRLFLDVAEVLCLRPFTLQTFLVRVQDDVVGCRSDGIGEIYRLRNIVDGSDG